MKQILPNWINKKSATIFTFSFLLVASKALSQSDENGMGIFGYPTSPAKQKKILQILESKKWQLLRVDTSCFDANVYHGKPTKEYYLTFTGKGKISATDDLFTQIRFKPRILEPFLYSDNSEYQMFYLNQKDGKYRFALSEVKDLDKDCKAIRYVFTEK